MKTRLRYQSERLYKQRVVKTRLRYQSERVARSSYKQRVVTTRLRYYQSKRVAKSSYKQDLWRHNCVTRASVSLGEVISKELWRHDYVTRASVFISKELWRHDYVTRASGSLGVVTSKELWRHDYVITRASVSPIAVISKSCEDTISLPEWRVATSMQQDRLRQTLVCKTSSALRECEALVWRTCF